MDRARYLGGAPAPEAMRRPLALALAALPLAAALALLTPARAQADLAGSYAVAGTNADGSAYDGALRVSRRGALYQFSWATGNDYEGVGVRRGDVVAVGWGGEGCGVAVYGVRRAGSELDGVWAFYGQEATGTERALRGTGHEGSVAGSFEMGGTGLDGAAYGGVLTVAPDGPLYRLTWETGPETYEGVGLRDGDALGASFGADTCGVALYRVRRDGALVGTWTTSGLGALGTETATRR